MAEEVELVGTVEGELGLALAGWAELEGKHRRVLGDRIIVRTDDGAEVEVVGVSGARIDPSTKREAPWSTLERDPIARLFVDRAPAPDVEVELVTTVVRGGDRVAVWGVIEERRVSRDAPRGEAFRSAAGSEVSKLSASVVAIGADATLRLQALRREKARVIEPSSPPPKQPKPVVEAKPRRVVDPNAPVFSSYATWNPGLWITVLGGGALAALAVSVPHLRIPLLVIGSVVLCAPAVIDSVMLPTFRTAGVGKDRSLAGILVFGVVASFALIAFQDTATLDARRSSVGAFTFVAAGLAVLAAVGCAVLDRRRRRLVALLATAPPHPRPLEDGVWGATDGNVVLGPGAVELGKVKAAIAEGGKAHWWGNATKDAAGVRHRNVTASDIRGFMLELDVVTEAGNVRVAMSGALWLTMVSFSQRTGEDRGVGGDVITDKTPVRVVGRAHNKTLVKGGEESLLVFAAPEGASVSATLARLQLRHRVSTTMLALAGASVVVGIVLAIAGPFDSAPAPAPTQLEAP